MRLLVDQKLLPLRSDEGRAILKAIPDASFFCDDFAVRAGNTSHEVVAIAGLGVAVASLVVAVLQLIRSPSDQRSKDNLLEAAGRQLAANSCAVLEIKYDKNDIANVISLTGEPCNFAISFREGADVVVYLGATSAEIYVSAVEPDWRSLLLD